VEQKECPDAMIFKSGTGDLKGARWSENSSTLRKAKPNRKTPECCSHEVFG